MLRDHGAEEERKRHDLAEELLQEARDKWNKDRMERLDFINKRLREQNRQGHILTIPMKQYLNTIEHLQSK